MRVKNRLFPYPILHDNFIGTCFKNEIFLLDFQSSIDEENYIISIKPFITNKTLINLLKKGLGEIVCIVECPLAMFRKNYTIAMEGTTIKIPLFDLVGSLEVSGYIYATKDIDNYSPDNLCDEYFINNFSIEKYCILAINNGFNQKVYFDDLDDTKKKSIFVLVSNLDQNKKTIEWTYDSDLIKIYVPEFQHKEYESIKYNDASKKIFLSLFAVTPLSMIISDLVKSGETVEDLKFSYRWFVGFCNAYKKNFNKELIDEEFNKLESSDVYEVVQTIFDNSLCSAIDEVFILCNNIGGFHED